MFGISLDFSNIFYGCFQLPLTIEHTEIRVDAEMDEMIVNGNMSYK
jgi:hypothetical protein